VDECYQGPHQRLRRRVVLYHETVAEAARRQLIAESIERLSAQQTAADKYLRAREALEPALMLPKSPKQEDHVRHLLFKAQIRYVLWSSGCGICVRKEFFDISLALDVPVISNLHRLNERF